MTDRRAASLTNAIVLALLLTTLALYSQVRHFDFVRYDDQEYVLNNRHLRAGLSPQGIAWAFTSVEGANWFPLTRLSYLLEYRLFGLASGAYHLTNILLHALASAMLFLFLLRATGERWPSAFVASLFAVHPLHVESVAWVAERKDVLCAFFWFLTLWAWVRYTQRPAWPRYLWTLSFFAMGLMSKPMIVTLPCVLLLLDAWPLRRKYSRMPLMEKLPFFALSAASAGVTYLAQDRGGAVESLSAVPLGLRIENALVGWIVYIAKMFWPARLAALYPYPKHLPLWQAVVAGATLAIVSAAVLRCVKGRPYLAVGWFWYLGTLVPAIGLVQVGIQARADRYMYVPMVGLSIMLAWSGAALVRRRPQARPWVAALAAGALLALVPVAWLQMRYWKNSESLFRHTIAVTVDNQEAYLSLGVALATMPGRLNDAISVLETGLRINPQARYFQADIGSALLATRIPANLPAAVDHLRAALKTWPGDAQSHSNLALALIRMDRPAEAIVEARAALRVDPDSEVAHSDLSIALAATGQTTEAIDQAETVVRIAPESAPAHFLLGTTLAPLPGRRDEAIDQFREALRIKPDFADAHYNLGVALTGVPGATFEALFEFEEALRIAPGNRAPHVSLGLALAQIPGRLPEAIAYLRAAQQIQLDPALEITIEKLEIAQRRGGQ